MGWSKRFLLPGLFAFLPVLSLFITGCPNQVKTGRDIPLEGAVYCVHRSGGSIKTYFDLAVGRGFSDRLPDAVDAIVVLGPRGVPILSKDDFAYSPQWRSFRAVKSGFPETGTYTFKIAAGDRVGQAADAQKTVRVIDLPDVRYFSPAPKERVACIAPLFSWRLVKSDIPLFYQVEIRDAADRRHVYRSDYSRDMASLRPPPQVLKPAKAYQWRIRVADAGKWRAIDNRAQSQWIGFYTNDRLDCGKYTYKMPPETDDGWKTASLDAQGVDRQKIEALMRRVVCNEIKKIHGVLLIKNDRLILEEYFGGYHRSLKQWVASATKSVTSILLGIARDQGRRIEPGDPVAGYLPEYGDLFSGGKKSGITLEHLLTMRAGLYWDELNAPTSLQHMYESPDPIRYVLEQKLVDPPGERFFYSTGLSTVLGRVLANTTGSDADRFARKHLFAPLGISDFDWKKLSDGTVLTGSDLYLRPRDMAKIGKLYLKNGIWRDRRIVSEKWVRDSIYPHVRQGELISGGAYGYQWWRGTLTMDGRKIRSFYAAGHGGQFIAVFPALDVIIVITSQVLDNNAGDFRAYSIIENDLIPAVLNTDPPAEKLLAGGEAGRRLTGRYRWAKARLGLKIFAENGRLYGKTVLFDGKFEIFPAGKGKFRCVSGDIGSFRLDAVEGPDGSVAGVKLVIGFSSIPFQRKRGIF